MICHICDREFTDAEIEEGIPVPAGRHRLTRINGVVHDFSILGKGVGKKKTNANAMVIVTPATAVPPIIERVPEVYELVEKKSTPIEPAVVTSAEVTPDVVSLADRLAERWNPELVQPYITPDEPENVYQGIQIGETHDCVVVDWQGSAGFARALALPHIRGRRNGLWFCQENIVTEGQITIGCKIRGRVEQSCNSKFDTSCLKEVEIFKTRWEG